MAQQQTFFSYQTEAVLTALAQDLQKAADLVRIYNARLYGPGGAAAITQADLDPGLNGQTIKGTPDDIYAGVILLDSLGAFVAQSAYKSTLDKLRQDY